ncbi:MAG: thioredoxin domain-containing protein [Patescibacteria group bacterium]
MFKKKIPNRLKPILIFLAILAMAFLIIIVISLTLPDRQKTNEARGRLLSNNMVTYWDAEIPQPKADDTSPTLGDGKAPITIFEFSSFDCNFCAQIQPIIKKIVTAYPKKVKIVWKDLPLNPNDESAMLAHQAARCADKQDKFWPYADLLWQNQKDFSEKNLIALANQLKLDEKSFKECLLDQSVRELIENDIIEADNLLLPGSPYFYIGSEELMGLATFEDFKNIIEKIK